ncbi:hypothetical protein LCGC14_1518010 [marine sediment metagenome]|uniref:Uncharacterized protein n=1 Tax=marine sediment metagenome TaxID=412755 RepID=A0A0F9IZR2_9ZZZZ
MEKEKKYKLILLIVFFLNLTGALLNIMVSNPEILKETVPLTGMPYYLHVTVFYIIWPILLSIIFAIIFPLIIVPFFMMFKRIVWSRFQNCYVEMGELTLDFKTFIKRGIYMALMIIGIIITISAFIDPTLFLTQAKLEGSYYTANDNKDLLFDPDVINALAYIILPFVVGIWAVGWAIEDAGLMHYKVPKENEKILFEIEPVHLKYNGLVKGYAGVASVIFLITAIIVYLPIWPGHIGQVLFTILLMMFYSAPSYIIYLKVSQAVFRKILRKGLKEIEMLSENDIKLI